MPQLRLRATCAAFGLVAGPALVAQSSPCPPTLPSSFTNRAVVFEPGQGTHDISYFARAKTYDAAVTDTALLLTLPADDHSQQMLRIVPVGGQLLRPAGERRLSSTSHYYLTGRPEDWRLDVPHYDGVRCAAVWPGIDLKLYAIGGEIAFDLELAPNVDASAIQLRYEGATALSVKPNGDLVVHLPRGELVQRAPIVWQTAGTTRQPIDGRYRVDGATTVSFELAPIDPALPLTIDPVLVYSTYLGGSLRDDAAAITVDGAGCAYVTGTTASSNFPTKNAYQATGSNTVFVFKLDPQGQLVWSTYIGAPGSGLAYGIAVDDKGVYVVGDCTSSYPVTANAAQTQSGGPGLDAFLSRISHTPQTVPFYSTYLGGNSNDTAYAVTTARPGSGAAGGTAWIAGFTNSTDYPVTPGTLNATTPGLFVARIDIGSPLVMSARIGGHGTPRGIAIANQSALNDVVVTGDARAIFPVTAGAAQTVFGGGAWDGFCCRLIGDGTALAWATFVGGFDQDWPQSLVLDAQNNAYVTGWTRSTNMPLVNAIDVTAAGTEGFVTKLAADGRSFIWSTYLGGALDDYCYGIAMDGASELYIGGGTSSPDFPVRDAFQAAIWGSGDAFVTSLSNDGQMIRNSTLVGGSGAEAARGIAVLADGTALITGIANGGDWPTQNAIQTAATGDFDVFVTRLTAWSATAYGAGTRGPRTGVLPNLAAGDAPRIGTTVNLDVRSGLGGALGGVFLGLAGRASIPVHNGTALIAPPIYPLAAFNLNGVVNQPHAGWYTVGLPIPNNPWLIGFQLNFQAFFVDDVSVFFMSFTNGVEFTIQA